MFAVSYISNISDCQCSAVQCSSILGLAQFSPEGLSVILGTASLPGPEGAGGVHQGAEHQLPGNEGEQGDEDFLGRHRDCSCHHGVLTPPLALTCMAMPSALSSWSTHRMWTRRFPT